MNSVFSVQFTFPAERPLTVLLDEHELVTLMTLGASPELLVLGFLVNQRLIGSAAAIESISVDWKSGTATVRSRGAPARDLAPPPRRSGLRQRPRLGILAHAHAAYRCRQAARSILEARIRGSTLLQLAGCHAPARQHPPARQVGAQLRAVSRCAPAGVRRGCEPAQCSRYHMRVDGAARHQRRRQGVVHHRAVDGRDGHQGGAMRRAHHGISQRCVGHGI